MSTPPRELLEWRRFVEASAFENARGSRRSNYTGGPPYTMLTITSGSDSDGNLITDGLDVLLVRRSRALVFCVSAWVFPAGRVDPEDAAVGADLQDEPAGRAAAARETLEETSLALTPQVLVRVPQERER